MSEHSDVLIVGGGPGGSTLGRALARQGMDVTIVDKQTFPRDKVCAGWVTPAVMESLDVDPDAYARDAVLQPIHAFRTGMLGQRTVVSRYPEPASYGIRRYEFDAWLLERAIADGVRTAQGQPMKDLRYEGGEWVLNDHLRAPLLVGAGGHFCPVARHLGAAKPGSSETAVHAQEIEFEMTPEQAADCPVEADVPELYFLRDLSGYGWIVRKGDWLNIGLGREGGQKLGEQVTAFADELKAMGRLHIDPPSKFKGHAYLLHGHSPRPPVHEGALLIGDAAGLAYPQSGEGIRPAVESALMA
ncbi:MAG: NAD(P)/FAD-dependent oxidoreductase, partial [Pseudomonadota bacterium]